MSILFAIWQRAASSIFGAAGVARALNLGREPIFDSSFLFREEGSAFGLAACCFEFVAVPTSAEHSSAVLGTRLHTIIGPASLPLPASSRAFVAGAPNTSHMYLYMHSYM